jgi:hypothetical protein
MSLSRSASRQSDPELVERFIEVALARDETRTAPKPALSEAMPLEVSQAVEKIAIARDNCDYSQLSCIASRLAAVVTEHGLQEVADLATQMVEAARAQGDLLTIASLTKKLIQACRLPDAVGFGR